MSWVRDFLSARKGQLRYEGCLCESLDFVNGTPQGSCLSPFLFNVAMDELIDSKIPKRVEMVAYAVDLILCCTDSSEDKVMKKMQDSLDILGPIAPSSGFKFSLAKTKATQVVA